MVVLESRGLLQLQRLIPQFALTALCCLHRSTGQCFLVGSGFYGLVSWSARAQGLVFAVPVLTLLGLECFGLGILTPHQKVLRRVCFKVMRPPTLKGPVQSASRTLGLPHLDVYSHNSVHGSSSSRTSGGGKTSLCWSPSAISIQIL